MPGQPARAHARFRSFPRQFTLENCQSATGSAAIIQLASFRNATFSLNPLSASMLRPAIENITRLCRNCGRVRLRCGSRGKPWMKSRQRNHNRRDFVLKGRGFKPRRKARKKSTAASAAERIVIPRMTFPLVRLWREFFRARLDAIDVAWRRGKPLVWHGRPRLRKPGSAVKERRFSAA